MGKVYYEDPIHHISGKISRKYRTIYNHRTLSQHNFTSVRGAVSVASTAEQMQVRNKFRIVRLAVSTRLQDPTHYAADQLKFRAARDAGSKYTTFSGWLFSKGWQYYNDSTHQVDWPASL